MRIRTISATRIEPVKTFEVDGLSDLVVIAGPNGVGKTRLVTALLSQLQNLNGSNPAFIVEATDRSERDAWDKSELDTRNAQDAAKLKSLLQQNRRRRNFKSSVIYYESNRSIQNIQPLKFQFDFPDPWEENVGWQSTFGGLASRWQDTQHAIFKKIQSQKVSIANRAIQLKSSGHESMNLEFSDPLDPFRDAFSKLLGPKELQGADIQSQRLIYLENGEARPVETLSSGEREVLNITFDFILRRPSHCIVFFDEPELHLHPELLGRLVTTLGSVGTSNQFILVSHSPDVIASSLEDTVVFLSPPYEDSAKNQAILLDSESRATEALHRLGQSVGVISLGRKIVLIEGSEASLDKKTYSHILENRFPQLVLLPSGGKGNLHSFSRIAEEILDRTLWGIRFFMLADRDASPGLVEYPDFSNFRVLGKYHLENYFLDAKVISGCFSDLEEPGSWLRSPSEIESRLRSIAREQLSYAASLIVAKIIRGAVGSASAMPKGVDQAADQEQFAKMFGLKGEEELERMRGILEPDEIRDTAARVYAELERLLDDSSNAWKREFPGKPVFSRFCSIAGMRVGRMKTLYLAHADTAAETPFQEIIDIFSDFTRS